MGFNWTKIAVVVSALAFVVLIAMVVVGSQDCSHKEFPFLCFVRQLFHG